MQFLCKYSRQSNIQAMKNSKDHLINDKQTLTCLFFGKASVLSNMESEISPTHQINDKVEIISVFKCIVHIN